MDSTDGRNAKGREPTLSITVLNYNYAHYLPKCLDSILAQTFRDYELILINDRSTDNSLEVIAPYLRDPRIRLVDHEVNRGFARSLVEGAELSRGKYITVVSADDWVLEPTAFEKQVALLDSDDQVAFVCTAYGCFRTNDEKIYEQRPAPPVRVREGIEAFESVIIDRAVLHSGTVIRRTAYERIGGYDVDTRYAIDTKMWAGLCQVGRVGYLDEVLHAYRVHDKNMSKDKEVVRRTIIELLDIIDWSFGLAAKSGDARLGPLYKKAVKRALASYPVFFTFRENNLQLGWYFLLFGARLRPAEALLQPTTVALMLRTVLGLRGYEAVERGRTLLRNRGRKGGEPAEPQRG
jgi:glycosyltransferase involved in cell wall biosynthesis